MGQGARRWSQLRAGGICIRSTRCPVSMDVLVGPSKGQGQGWVI